MFATYRCKTDVRCLWEFARLECAASVKYVWSTECPFPKRSRVKSQEENTRGLWAQPLLTYRTQRLEMIQ